MSRGLGRVERFVLGYLSEGHAPAVPSLGHSARQMARVMTGDDTPTRSQVATVTRAMRELHEAGLIILVSPQIRRHGANVFAQALR